MTKIPIPQAMIGRVLRSAWIGRGLWHRLARPLTMGVRAIVIDRPDTNSRSDDRNSGEGEHVLLIRHSYVGGWHLPGGGVDRNETMVDAMRREVREEVGLTVLDTGSQPRSIHGRFRNGASDHVAVFVISSWSGTPVADGVEILETRFYPLTALPADTTEATRRRLEEYRLGLAGDPIW